MLLTTAQIATITGGSVIGDSNLIIRQLVTDSRSHLSSPDCLFIALVGDRRDGHDFLPETYAKGIRTFLVSKLPERSFGEDTTYIVVNDTLIALQQLASRHRKAYSFPVIGITGSNGKTIVKEWLNTLLADDFVIVRSPHSYNSQLGVPLSVLAIDAIHTLGIFEAGISQPGEMKNLASIIQPDIGVLTTIGSSHLEFFADKNEVAQEKVRLFSSCHTVVYPADNKYAREAITSLDANKNLISWGSSPDATLRIMATAEFGSSTRAILKLQDNEFSMQIPFTDEASVQNALCCLTVLISLGYNLESCAQRLGRLEPVSMRMELLNGIHDSIILNDSWSADPDALRIALGVLKQRAGNRPLVVILSDILQTGIPQQELYQKVSDLLREYGVSKLFAVGPNIHSASGVFQVPVVFYGSTEELIGCIEDEIPEKPAILVKGARGFQFERIVRRLGESTHDSWLEINEAALSSNLNVFKAKIRPEVKIMVMVKAFGYGSGAREVSALLEFNKVDYLAVAYADEGVALREAGISLPIMVMNPGRSALAAMIRHRLEPEIFSLRILKEWIGARKESGITTPSAIHLKIDSGMHRLGFSPDETERMLGMLEMDPGVRIASVFTHLAGAENPAHDAFTREQIARLQSVVTAIRRVRNDSFVVHALNTGGIERFPEFQFDMVRLGIGLYGVSPAESEKNTLIPVVRLLTRISQIRDVPKGDSVGYDRSFVASEDMKIAILPVGYADGIRRSLSNGIGKVSIGGSRAPIVGKVCMDMTMVDVTHIECKEGDVAEVFGREIPLDEFARWNQTIPYEVLTTIGQRLRRVYVRE